MSIEENIRQIKAELTPGVRLVAVSKTKPAAMLQQAYEAGCLIFGENKAQEMAQKYALLPHKDIQWHMIGHLQTNKVKYIAPFVSLIHSVDSFKVLQEIDRQAARHERVIDCLLQVHIAEEDTKFGFLPDELPAFVTSTDWAALPHVRVTGLMGLATFGASEAQLRREFGSLRGLFESLKASENERFVMRELSMGMSGDYGLAMEEGSTLVRIGSAIFGARPSLHP